MFYWEAPLSILRRHLDFSTYESGISERTVTKNIENIDEETRYSKVAMDLSGHS